MKKVMIAAAMSFYSLSCFAAIAQTPQVNPVTGAASWEINEHGVNFSLTQILPQQAQAFYVNRGFTLKQIESYTSSCVFMAVLRNDNAPGTIHFVRKNWSVLVDGKSHHLLSVDDWLQRLTETNIKKSALIAFRWAQFPSEQKYEPGGDWNQGMLSVGLPPGSVFNLIARWDIDGKPYETKLQEVYCAK